MVTTFARIIRTNTKGLNNYHQMKKGALNSCEHWSHYEHSLLTVIGIYMDTIWDKHSILNWYRIELMDTHNLKQQLYSWTLKITEIISILYIFLDNRKKHFWPLNNLTISYKYDRFNENIKFYLKIIRCNYDLARRKDFILCLEVYI